jgi:folate-binding protein YgfZ
MGSFIDVSGSVVLSLVGADSLDFLQRISTNDLALLKPGGNAQTILTNEKGRIIDIVGIVFLNEGRFLIVGQSRDPGRLMSWIEKYIIMEHIKIDDVTSLFSQYLVYGTDVCPYTNSTQGLAHDSATFEEVWGTTKTYRVITPSETGADVQIGLSERGFLPVTNEAFEEYRIFHGIPIVPNELSVLYNPLEAKISSLVSWTKGCYIGQEVIARLDTYKKVQRRLVRMAMGESPMSVPAPFFDGDGEAGTITSAVIVAAHGGCRGLGYLKTSRAPGRHDFFFLRNDEKIALNIEAD